LNTVRACASSGFSFFEIVPIDDLVVIHDEIHWKRDLVGETRGLIGAADKERKM